MRAVEVVQIGGDRDRGTFIKSDSVTATQMAVWFCVPFILAGQQPSTVPPATPASVVLDGAKTPELFPQWFIWETFLRSFRASAAGMSMLHKELGIAEGDADSRLLIAAAETFRRAEAALGDGLRAARTRRQAEGKTEDQIRDATQKIDLEYRERVLEIRGRIYSALNPLALDRLLASMRRSLSGTRVRLSGHTLDYFHRPW